MTRKEFIEIFNAEIYTYTDDCSDHIMAVEDPLDDDLVFLDIKFDDYHLAAFSDVSISNLTRYMVIKIAEMAHSAYSISKFSFLDGKIAGIREMRSHLYGQN